jgi:hypothetical protein
MYVLCDPWDINSNLSNFATKQFCASIDERPGYVPFFEKLRHAYASIGLTRLHVTITGHVLACMREQQPQVRDELSSTQTTTYVILYDAHYVTIW